MDLDPRLTAAMRQTGYSADHDDAELSGTRFSPPLAKLDSSAPLSNGEIIDAIEGMKLAIEADPHGGVRDLVLRHLLRAEIIDALPESALDPFRPCPEEWTAMQIGYFDNGEPKAGRKRYRLGKDGQRREHIQRTKMRFGGNIKVWTRDEISFKNAKQIAWQANFYCWTREQALAISHDLRDESYIDDATVAKMTEMATGAGEQVRFSIPLLKTPEGTRWMRGHIVVTVLDNAGFPDKIGIAFPTAEFATKEPLAIALANGEELAGNAVRQARIGRQSDFGTWATECLS